MWHLRKKLLCCQPAKMPADLYTSLLIYCCRLLVCLKFRAPILVQALVWPWVFNNAKHSQHGIPQDSVCCNSHIYILRAEWHCDSSDSSKAIRALLVCKTSQVADKGQQTPKGTSLEVHFSHANLHLEQTLMLLAIPASHENIDRGC